MITILWWFCHTWTGISHGCTCIPPSWTPLPLSPSHPSGLSQCTTFECPASCIKLALIIYFTYDNIHVSNHDGMITHLEPDILECEVKWALESIITNKASGGDGIPVELFQILKDDAVKVLHSICQWIWKTQQWPQDWKRSVFIPIPKKMQITFKLLHNCTHFAH